MTRVGQILVIVIMIFALLFLAFSTVVFTTEQHWKQATEDVKKQLTDVRSDLNKAKEELGKVTNDLTAEKQAAEDRRKTHEAEVANLNRQVDLRQAEITKQRTAVETSQQNVRAAQDEAAARFDQTK